MANKNFGSGSSREHAPQALKRWGICACIAESFSDIFRGNSLSIGLPSFTAAHSDVEFLMDYGAYREFKRHRMMTYLPQPLTVAHGYRIPEVVAQAGLESEFEETVGPAEEAYWKVREVSLVAAQYLVTHAHNRRVLTKMNLRECYHLFKLRTSDEAHFDKG